MNNFRIPSFEWTPATKYLMSEMLKIAYLSSNTQDYVGDSPGTVNPFSYRNHNTNLWTSTSLYVDVISPLERGGIITPLVAGGQDYQITDNGAIEYLQMFQADAAAYAEGIKKAQLELEQLLTQININKYTLRDWIINKWIAIIGGCVGFIGLVISIITLITS